MARGRLSALVLSEAERSDLTSLAARRNTAQALALRARIVLGCAVVLCVDEKSQIQALDRSQPMLPMRPGQPARRSHDYVRHGTTSLFAALDIATGRVIGKCYPRHRATEFRKFLDEIEANVPRDLDSIS